MKPLTRKRRRKVHRQRTRIIVLSHPVCWCGEQNPYYAPARGGCGGFGSFDCHCGGDICVCHNHGEIECFGCSDCDIDPEVMSGDYLQEEYQ